jgi:beta-N-acetylhexosaminidase
MARAWRRALTARGNAPSRPGARVRLVARQDVVSDGVSEAGRAGGAHRGLAGKLYESSW